LVGGVGVATGPAEWLMVSIFSGFRHSNVRCDDDAASCIREAAIKFADQNEDGPLDLILLTGRTSLARSSNTLLAVMNLSKPADIKDACQRDPYLYACSLLLCRLVLKTGKCKCHIAPSPPPGEGSSQQVWHALSRDFT